MIDGYVPPDAVNTACHHSAGGSVQQGLSAAGGALGFYQHGLAADKRYSLAISTKGIIVVNPYPIEKFNSAVRSMATSQKSIQERVCDAYVFNLIHVKSEDIPESVRYRFVQLKEKLTSGKPVGSEGTVAATTNKMSDTEAIETAQEIMSIFDEVTHQA